MKDDFELVKTLIQKDKALALAEKDKELYEKDSALCEKDSALSEKDSALEFLKYKLKVIMDKALDDKEHLKFKLEAHSKELMKQGGLLSSPLDHRVLRKLNQNRNEPSRKKYG